MGLRSPLGSVFAFISFLLAIVGSAAAVALAIVLFFGSSQYGHHVLNHVYWLKLIPQAGGTVIGAASDLPTLTTYDEFIIGSAGYCTKKDDKTKCYSDVPKPFWITWNQMSKDIDGEGIRIPEAVADYDKKLKIGQRALYVFNIMAIACLGVAFILGFISLCSHFTAAATAGFSLLGFLFILITSGLGTGLYIAYRNKLHADNYMEKRPELGVAAMVLTWLSTVCSLWSLLWWSSLSAHKRRHAQKPVAYYA